MLKKGTFLLFALAILGFAVLVLHPFKGLPGSLSFRAKPLKLQLERGPFTVLDFPSLKPFTSALVLFGSGDGGWGSLEESISHALQMRGYEVVGIDFNDYAQSDYTLDILQSDYRKMAASVPDALAGKHLPLILGGYSMGAAQAIAGAGGPHPPPGLVGLLVIDPLSRGRYGLRETDEMNLLPEGPGTFDAISFAPSVHALRVIQWHAEKDSIDSHAWLDNLGEPHRFYTFPGAGHSYTRNREDFIRELLATVSWLVQPSPDSLKTAKVGAEP